MSAYEPSARELELLADKYRVLAELRRNQDAGLPAPEAVVLRELAGAFPGCLRELDRLPLDEIERRRAILTAASSTGELEPWMRWLFAFHGVLRAALFLRTRRSHDAVTGLTDLARETSQHARYPIETKLLEALTLRPGRPMIAIAIEEVTTRFDVDEARVRTSLFPPIT